MARQEPDVIACARSDRSRDVSSLGESSKEEVEVDEPGDAGERFEPLLDLVVPGIVVEAEEPPQCVAGADVVPGVDVEATEAPQ